MSGSIEMGDFKAPTQIKYPCGKCGDTTTTFFESFNMDNGKSVTIKYKPRYEIDDPERTYSKLGVCKICEQITRIKE